MIAPWVAELLCCPACRGDLEQSSDGMMSCRACGAAYAAEPTPLLVEPGRSAPRAPILSAVALERRWAAFRERPWIGDEMIDEQPTGSIVLAVGEGYGEIVLRLAQRRRDLRFVAFDLLADRIAQARERQARLQIDNCWFCVADATRLPFKEGAFAAGYARGVLQVLPDPRAAIEELRRTVRSRLFVDQLANRPFLTFWFKLFQRYENARALWQRRAPDPRIWGEIEETLQIIGTYWPLPRYRRWFVWAHRVRVRANCLAVWETGRHHRWLGWFGYAGAVDVWF